jgi:hypothetical protein
VSFFVFSQWQGFKESTLADWTKEEMLMADRQRWQCLPWIKPTGTQTLFVLEPHTSKLTFDSPPIELRQ